MKRALVLAEGDTEERFIKEVLRGHFWNLGLDLAPTLLTTKRVKSGGSFRGGVTSFGKFENDARRLLGSCGGTLVTTMLDYYRLPTDFPGMNSRPAGDALSRVKHVEAAIKAHFESPGNFVPYLSLHEFEALLFSSTDVLAKALIATPQAADALKPSAVIPASRRQKISTNGRATHRPKESWLSFRHTAKNSTVRRLPSGLDWKDCGPNARTSARG